MTTRMKSRPRIQLRRRTHTAEKFDLQNNAATAGKLRRSVSFEGVKRSSDNLETKRRSVSVTQRREFDENYLQDAEIKENPDTDSSSESDYDTDLEDEGERLIKTLSHHDWTQEEIYREACSRMGTEPLSRATRGLTCPQLLLSYSCINDKELVAISEPLMVNVFVREIHLAGNLIDIQGVRFLCAALKENVYVSFLDLSENDISGGLNHIVELVDTNNTIRELHLSCTGIMDCHMEEIKQLLLIVSGLKALNLSHNQLGDHFGEVFRDVMPENDGLHYLDVSWNNLRHKGAKFLCMGLADNVGLQNLNLAWNGFADVGARQLGLALKENNTLKSLDVSQNRIGHEGIMTMLNGLKLNESLRELKLNKNHFSIPAALEILNLAFLPHSRLESLDIAGVDINSEFELRLLDLKDIKPNFRVRHGAKLALDAVYPERLSPLWGTLADPVFYLMEYVKLNNLRLLDIFSQFDQDKSMTVTAKEFIKGIKLAHIPLSRLQIETLLRKLDKNNDGEVDFAELLLAQRKHRTYRRKMQELENELGSRKVSRAGSRAGSRDGSRAGSPLPGLIDMSKPLANDQLPPPSAMKHGKRWEALDLNL